VLPRGRRASAPAQAAQPPATPAAPPAPPIGYACESGKTVVVQYPDTSTAQLGYNGQTYVLRTVQAASGARYAGSGVEWWTATRDGQETATLSRLGPNQDVGVAILERCSRPASGIDTPVGPTPLPTPAPGGVLPAALPCKSNQLKLSADGGDAGMGHRLATLGVQNIGAPGLQHHRLSDRGPAGRARPVSLTAIRDRSASGQLSERRHGPASGQSGAPGQGLFRHRLDRRPQ
jgi:membrane-bound inhibitor of C-type lysozyme